LVKHNTQIYSEKQQGRNKAPDSGDKDFPKLAGGAASWSYGQGYLRESLLHSTRRRGRLKSKKKPSISARL
ncbi:hypothetical protein, partial [Thiolapillus sp.]|uniref:hypothetical protein n=1 Tax=Thiolapillus sp. TaxID=2017437 RepID=UPI0025D489E5